MIELKIRNSGKWHPEFSVYYNDDFVFSAKENIGGCGSLLLYNWLGTTVTEGVIKASLDHVINIIVNNKGKLNLSDYIDVGMISFVSGSHHDLGKFVQAAKKVGFKEIAEYRNPRHGTNRQKLYCWTINEADKLNKADENNK